MPAVASRLRLLGCALVLLSGCATAPGIPGKPAPPGPAAPDRKAPPATTSTAPPMLPVPPPAVRLAWVNPARCLPTCTYDPSPQLIRVNDRGKPDPRGHHRVARTIQPAVAELIGAALGDGHPMKIASAFRSYRDQAQVFQTTREPGRAARPGHSEHQLGTAVDIRLPTSAAITWLAERAPAFGFALSYPPGRQRVTGYRPEPWHVRFVGRELAEAIQRNDASVEETLRARPELGESGTCQDCPLPASRATCGPVTPTGLCRGTVLTWCYEQALATVDCAASGQRCGPSPQTGAPDCL